MNIDTYRVNVVTWNVGTQFPDNISLYSLLCLNDQQSVCMPAIYAIGLQDVNVQQQLLGLFKEHPWITKVKDLLCTFDYVLVKTKQLQGILLMVYVKRFYIVHLRDIQTSYTRADTHGRWDKNGVVSIRFNFHDCALVFINCHLVGQEEHVKERIVAFKKIIENHYYHVKQYRNIIDHDYVFWFGDLNFRLNGDDSASDLDKLIRNTKDFNSLFKLDQLRYIREETKEAFNMFHECQPTFPPTFKFKKDTCQYDLKRRPAWTDRILYAVQPKYNKSEHINRQLEILQKSYHSHAEYSISDHKPVSCVFTIRLHSGFKTSGIEFHPIDVWIIGKENLVEYRRPLEFEEHLHDWIGIFSMNFSSLSDYIAYEYISQMNSSPNMHNLTKDPFLEHSSQQGHRNRVRQHNKAVEIIQLKFTNEVELKDKNQYILIYFQSFNRNVTSVAGISNAFYARLNPTKC